MDTIPTTLKHIFARVISDLAISFDHSKNLVLYINAYHFIAAIHLDSGTISRVFKKTMSFSSQCIFSYSTVLNLKEK